MSSMRRFGLRLFLVSLGVFFTGSMVVYAMTSLSRPSSVGQLNMLALRAWRNHPLTPQHLHNVRGCATYWHFLEVVWLSMFAAFLLLG